MNNTTSFKFADATVPFVYDGRDRMVLPQQYSPGIDVVIIGRGNKVKQHPANIRFRALIQSQLENYSNAATKGLKSNILWRVLNEVRSYSASRLGFVKRDSDSGRWYAIDDASAKINISQAFRDGLNTYKSSKKHKQLKRKQTIDEENAKNEESKLEASIFASLERFENKLESPSGNKRVRVTLNQPIGEASEPHDHTIGRLGATMDRLRHFLSGQTTIPLEADSNQLNMLLKDNQKANSYDTFSRLCTQFGSRSKLSEDDPFEPSPLTSTSGAASARATATAASSHQSQQSRRNYTWDTEPESSFPRFAMAEMVERTNPPDTLSINTAIFDSTTCMQEAMLPSILSLNTLELSEAGALGMTSFSSLSDISDSQDLQDIWDTCRSKRKVGRSTTTCSV